MFTKQELDSEFPRQLALAPVPIDVFAFDHSDFAPETKQYLWVFEGKKNAVGTALALWIEAIIALHDSGWPFHSRHMECIYNAIDKVQFAEKISSFTRMLEERFLRFYVISTSFCGECTCTTNGTNIVF